MLSPSVGREEDSALHSSFTLLSLSFVFSSCFAWNTTGRAVWYCSHFAGLCRVTSLFVRVQMCACPTHTDEKNDVRPFSPRVTVHFLFPSTLIEGLCMTHSWSDCIPFSRLQRFGWFALPFWGRYTQLQTQTTPELCCFLNSWWKCLWNVGACSCLWLSRKKLKKVVLLSLQTEEAPTETTTPGCDSTFRRVLVHTESMPSQHYISHLIKRAASFV